MNQAERLREKSAHYLQCFVNDCPRHETCLRWLCGQHTQETGINIISVNPMNPGVRANECEMYRENLTTRYAIGMMHFYDEVPGRLERSIKRRLIHLFSRKTYYDYRKGARPIPPEAQETIARISREEGWTGELHYDGWEDDFQW